ncbi:MAG: HEAT repeat domain-containing protein [Planctomycetota bacterium]|nr:HEAT repeat domain-containing protein [Planctomycetota bacterium]
MKMLFDGLRAARVAAHIGICVLVGSAAAPVGAAAAAAGERPVRGEKEGQETPKIPPEAKGELLDNAKLLALLKAKVPEEIILRKIEVSECDFDDSAEQIAKFQEAGATPKILGVLIDKALVKRKRVKTIVDIAENDFENVDGYEAALRRLTREGMATIPYLVKYLENESEKKRAGSVEAIGRIGDRSAAVRKHIIPMLYDTSPAVRNRAAQALASQSDDKTFEDVAAMFLRRGEKNDGVAQVFGYLGDKRAVPLLVEAVRDRLDPDVRMSAAWSLGRLGVKSREVIDVLMNALVDDRSEKVRSAAAAALADLRADGAARAFIKAYDRYPEGREEILRAMRHLKTHESIEFLIQCLNEEDRKLSRTAHESLVMMTGEKFENSQDVWLGWWSNAKKTPRYIRIGEEGLPETPPVPTPPDRTGGGRGEGAGTGAAGGVREAGSSEGGGGGPDKPAAGDKKDGGAAPGKDGAEAAGPKGEPGPKETGKPLEKSTP